MSRYAVKFTKNGFLKYTSHLDMLRLFKRIIKRADIRLKYSQGFNPHPKMGFAQPLSLGYESMCELLEIETSTDYMCEDIRERLSSRLPEGISVKAVRLLSDNGKSLAASCFAAEYFIAVPVDESFSGKEKKLTQDYLSQKEIMVFKKQKKSKEMKEINIRGKIRDMDVTFVDNNYIMTITVDCGSESNLSPELVISSFLDFSGINTERSEIEVMRRKLLFRDYDFM